MHPWVILFDIDGTLLTVNNTFNRPLLRSILDHLDIHYPQMESDTFSGRTDHDIMMSFLVNHDFDRDLYQSFKENYIHELEKKLNSIHITRHPYIDESLNFFSGSNFIPGLLTGNYPKAAEIKLKAADIHHDFKVGAFGDQHQNRNDLPEIALKRAEKILAQTPDPSRFIVIGDTPKDIECAKHAGMKSVAVSTGHYTSEELKKYKPDITLESLADPQAWFEEVTRSQL